MPPLVSHPRATPQQHGIPATPMVNQPGPDYFGFQSAVGDASNSQHDGPHCAKQHFSPPSSVVRSTAAATPGGVPLDQNPEFDAFRRQSEGKAFNLGTMNTGIRMSAPPAPGKHGRSDSRASPPSLKDPIQTAQSLDPASAELSRSPKRVLSPGSNILPEAERRASPASFVHSEPDHKKFEKRSLEAQPRFALPLEGKHSLTPGSLPKHRAETLPESNNPETTMMVTPQHVINLLNSKTEEVLLLDLRVSTQYATSHISGALNLCIPTTLLKRPSFNVQKLAETFKDDDQRNKFEHWRDSSYIIVHDASSALLKDAQICANTIKKFKSEGYTGTMYIVKGGFNDFATRFPQYVEDGIDAQRDSLNKLGVDSDGPEIAPVAGGCPMPATDKPANPFFGNIRQNMDLIGGVGQMALKHPSSAQTDASAEDEFPEWLRQASLDKDQGKMVAKKFELIEHREKKRMEDALSGKVVVGTPSSRKQQGGGGDDSVQIAGIEKGTKNRYNNIWPFEHSRVKLQGGARHCSDDYVNASHVKAAGSNKHYISTQAPIPATFNDFWNIVWQEDIRVIVMLTAEKEGAQVKAHNYWSQPTYGPLHLKPLSEKRASLEPARIARHRQHSSSNSNSTARPSAPKRHSTQVPLAPLDATETARASIADQPYVIVRRFALSHERFPFAPMREVTQLQYSNWPDFGAPAHPAHLLGLVEQTDAVVRAAGNAPARETAGAESGRAAKRPVLVHCSAGCGRTGTFCTVDSVIDMLKRQRLEKKEGEGEGDGEVQGRSGAGGGREPTPMEVESSPQPARTRAPEPPSKSGAKTSKNGSGGGGGGDGFFASVPAAPAIASQHRQQQQQQQQQHQPQQNQTQQTATAPTHTHTSSHPSSSSSSALPHDEAIDLVERTVEDFRTQRLSMVQSLRQFVLCYESVMEWLVEERAGGKGVGGARSA